VRGVARGDRTFPWYLNSAMGVLGIGGFFNAIGGIVVLLEKDQPHSTPQNIGAALAIVVGIAAIAAAGGMNAGHAWGWRIGVVVSAIVVVSGVLALNGPSAGLAAALTILIGILLLVALLLPGSRQLLRPAPPRPDEADVS
jgi:uncharacterized membrane protein (UPF0136 family)